MYPERLNVRKYQNKYNQKKDRRIISILFHAFHSRFIYGKPVETGKPYSCNYMKNNIYFFDNFSIAHVY